jgi:hypothetical protein
MTWGARGQGRGRWAGDGGAGEGRVRHGWRCAGSAGGGGGGGGTMWQRALKRRRPHLQQARRGAGLDERMEEHEQAPVELPPRHVLALCPLCVRLALAARRGGLQDRRALEHDGAHAAERPAPERHLLGALAGGLVGDEADLVGPHHVVGSKVDCHEDVLELRGGRGRGKGRRVSQGAARRAPGRGSPAGLVTAAAQRGAAQACCLDKPSRRAIGSCALPVW